MKCVWLGNVNWKEFSLLKGDLLPRLSAFSELTFSYSELPPPPQTFSRFLLPCCRFSEKKIPFHIFHSANAKNQGENFTISEKTWQSIYIMWKWKENVSTSTSKRNWQISQESFFSFVVEERIFFLLFCIVLDLSIPIRWKEEKESKSEQTFGVEER